MGEKTAIAWTDHTWNPWMGCHKVSQGCTHCYAETMTKNRMQIPDIWGLTGRRQRTGPAIWRRPFKWNAEAYQNLGRPARVFCASLADVFEDRPDTNAWRPDVWAVIRECRNLDFQLLTKRPENIHRMVPDDWSVENYPNVWLGTSIEDNRVSQRRDDLVQVPAIVHFISYEPAIGPLDEAHMSLYDIEWMIVGGESGPGYRPMDLEWARHMQRWCELTGTAFFFKQDAAPRTEMGIDALGGIFRDYPVSWDRSSRVAA